MSGAISPVFAQTPMSVRVPDPFAIAKEAAEAAATQYAPTAASAGIAKTQADTGLLGQQATLAGQQAIGAGLQNQITGNRLNLYQQAAIAGQQGQSSYPDQQAQPSAAPAAPAGIQAPSGGGAVPPATGFPVRPLSQPPSPAIGASSGTPGAPPAVPPSPAIGMGSLPAGGGPALPSIGLYGTTTDNSPTAPMALAQASPPAIGPYGYPSSGQPPRAETPVPNAPGGLRTGVGGVYDTQSGLGAIPWSSYFAIRNAMQGGGDVQAIINQAAVEKRAQIGALVHGTINPQTGLPDPQLWRQAVRTAYDRGLIDSAQEALWYDHPNLAPQMFSQAYTPTEQPSYKEATSQAEAQGKAPFEYVTRSVSDGNGNFHDESHTKAQWQQIEAGGTQTAPPNPNNPVVQGNAMSGEEYAARSMAAEGGAGTGPRPNASGPGGTPTSTAAGGEQFTNSTWVNQMRETYPQWSNQYTDQQLLGLRSNDRVSSQLALDYANHNAPILARAGLPATAANLELAKSLGPAAATQVLGAPANTPLSKVLSPAAMAANPTYANMTTGQMISNIRGRMGGGADLPVAGVTGGLQPGQATTGASGVGVGPPNLTPQQQSALRIKTEEQVAAKSAAAKANVDQITNYQNELLPRAQAANDMNAAIDQARVESQSWLPGTWAADRMKALAALDDIRQTYTQLTGKQSLGLPDEKIGDWETFNKTVGQITRQAVRDTSPRAAVQEYNMIAAALPSDVMAPQALSQMFNVLQGTNDWLQAKSVAAGHLAKDGSVNPNLFENEYNTNVSPMAFILHRMQPAEVQAWSQRVSQTQTGRNYIGQMKQQLQFLDRNGLLTPLNAGLPVGPQ